MNSFLILFTKQSTPQLSLVTETINYLQPYNLYQDISICKIPVYLRQIWPPRSSSFNFVWERTCPCMGLHGFTDGAAQKLLKLGVCPGPSSGPATKPSAFCVSTKKAATNCWLCPSGHFPLKYGTLQLQLATLWICWFSWQWVELNSHVVNVCPCLLWHEQAF